MRALDISLAELFADPQPVDNAKDAVIAQVCDQIRDLPLESIERINVIVRNVLAIEVIYRCIICKRGGQRLSTFDFYKKIEESAYRRLLCEKRVERWIVSKIT